MEITTFGKIILIGEHSVVYGKPAIAMPFEDTKLQVEIEESDRNYLDCKFYDGYLEEAEEELEGIKVMVNDFLESYKIDKKIKIIIESNIPNERGMGSSAAASVGVAKALFKYFGIEADINDIIELANVSEKIIHGNPSGIDINTVAHNKPLWFIKGQPFELFPIDLDAYMIIADSGKKGSTKEAVGDVRKLCERDNTYVSYIDELGTLTHRARKAIEDSNVDELGKIMNLAQVYLDKLTVSDKELDTMILESIKAGAIGSKLTGGGRGGCMISLAKDHDTAMKIKDALKNLGKDVWITYLKKR